MRFVTEVWSEVLAPAIDWRVAYPVVERQVRLWLDFMHGKGWDNHTTNELVEGLFPERLARGGEAVVARTRLYKAVQAMAPNALLDCCTKGPPRMLKRTKKMVRPWVWFKPLPAKCCPSCGQKLPPQPAEPASGATPSLAQSA